MATPLVGAALPISFAYLYIDGAYVPTQSNDFFSLVNPKDDTLVAQQIPIANEADVDLAVKHAEAAFNGPWAEFSAAQRAACFHNLADLLDEKLSGILVLDSLTTGNPVSLIPTREKNYIKNCLLYYGSSALDCNSG